MEWKVLLCGMRGPVGRLVALYDGGLCGYLAVEREEEAPLRRWKMSSACFRGLGFGGLPAEEHLREVHSASCLMELGVDPCNRALIAAGGRVCTPLPAVVGSVPATAWIFRPEGARRFPLLVLEQVYFARFDLAVGVGQFGDDR